MMRRRLRKDLMEAERKAFDSLARYKFQMFGYWAAIWVHLNRALGEKRPSPFYRLVNLARTIHSAKQGYRTTLYDEDEKDALEAEARETIEGIRRYVPGGACVSEDDIEPSAR